MKSNLALTTVLLLAACGYSSLGNESVGQVKKVQQYTPLICPDYLAANISYGVMRNGVGSMSTQDEWVYVPNKDDYTLLAKAAEDGLLVKVHYNSFRFSFCLPDHEVTSVEIVKN